MRLQVMSRIGGITITLALLACGDAGESSVAGVDRVGSLAMARSAENCVNIFAQGAGPLGVWQHEGNFVFGLVPSPIDIGGVPGLMGSFVQSETISGSKGQGAHHIILSHIFVADNDLGSFFTQDKATCAPADNNPATCAVKDHLTIVSGTGIYANASGSLHNHGWIQFTSVAPPAGTLDLSIRGRICGDGVREN